MLQQQQKHRYNCRQRKMSVNREHLHLSHFTSNHKNTQKNKQTLNWEMIVNFRWTPRYNKNHVMCKKYEDHMRPHNRHRRMVQIKFNGTVRNEPRRSAFTWNTYEIGLREYISSLTGQEMWSIFSCSYRDDENDIPFCRKAILVFLYLNCKCCSIFRTGKFIKQRIDWKSYKDCKNVFRFRTKYENILVRAEIEILSHFRWMHTAIIRNCRNDNNC